MRLGQRREKADSLLEKGNGPLAIPQNHRQINPYGVIRGVIIRVLAQQLFETGFDILELPFFLPESEADR